MSSEFLSACIRIPVLLSIFKQRPANFCHHYQCSPGEFSYFNHLMELILYEVSNQQDSGIPWRSLQKSAICLSACSGNNRSCSPAASRVRGQNVILSIQSYIENHLGGGLESETIADRFFLNKYYLSHIFKDDGLQL